MARREPERRKRRPSGARGSGAPRRATAPAAPIPAPASDADRTGLEARIGFALGAMAFLALPIAYQWTFRPASRPLGSDLLVPVLELGGILAAAAALFLGRRVRAVGDRSSGAIWAPRLGGAAIVGYAMTLVLTMARPG